MNQRERLLAIFNREKPDVTPWYADLSKEGNISWSKG